MFSTLHFIIDIESYPIIIFIVYFNFETLLYVFNFKTNFSNVVYSEERNLFSHNTSKKKIKTR